MNTLVALRVFLGLEHAFWKSSHQGWAVQFVQNYDNPLLVVLPAGGERAWSMLCQHFPEILTELLSLLYHMLPCSMMLARSGIPTSVWHSLDQETIIHSSIVLVSADISMTWNKFNIWLKRLQSRTSSSGLCYVGWSPYHCHFHYIWPILLLLANLATLGVPLLFLTATMPPRAVHTFQQLMQLPFLNIIHAPTHHHDINYIIRCVPPDKQWSHLFFQPGDEYISSFIEKITPFLQELHFESTKRGIIFCPNAIQVLQLLQTGGAYTGATVLADCVDLLENFRDGKVTTYKYLLEQLC